MNIFSLFFSGWGFVRRVAESSEGTQKCTTIYSVFRFTAKSRWSYMYHLWTKKMLGTDHYHFERSKGAMGKKEQVVFAIKVLWWTQKSIVQAIVQQKNSKSEKKDRSPENCPISHWCCRISGVGEKAGSHLICDQQLVSQQNPGRPNENNTSDHAMERHAGFACKISLQCCYYVVSS